MKQVRRTFVLIVIGAFCLSIVPVTQVQAVGDQKIGGLPPNTTVTITLPDGTTVEDQETDDDGNLVYPFPKGDSTITWSGGSKVVSTAGGSTAAVVGGVTAGIIGAGIIVGATDSDSNNNNPGSPSPGSVLALRVDNANTEMQLSGVNAGDTIPLSCMTGEGLGLPMDPIPMVQNGCTVSQCPIPPGSGGENHVHETINIAVLSASANDNDPTGCGHGCLVSTSNPTVTCIVP